MTLWLHSQRHVCLIQEHIILFQSCTLYSSVCLHELTLLLNWASSTFSYCLTIPSMSKVSVCKNVSLVSCTEHVWSPAALVGGLVHSPRNHMWPSDCSWGPLSSTVRGDFVMDHKEWARRESHVAQTLHIWVSLDPKFRNAFLWYLDILYQNFGCLCFFSLWDVLIFTQTNINKMTTCPRNLLIPTQENCDSHTESTAKF